MVGVHRRDDPAVLSAGRGCHGVVVAPAASASDVRRGLDEFVVDGVGLRGHLVCLRQVSGDVDASDEGAQANIGSVLVPPDDVAADHAAVFLVAGVVGAVQSEVPQGGELGLDPFSHELAVGV